MGDSEPQLHLELSNSNQFQKAPVPLRAIQEEDEDEVLHNLLQRHRAITD